MTITCFLFSPMENASRSTPQVRTFFHTVDDIQIISSRLTYTSTLLTATRRDPAAYVLLMIISFLSVVLFVSLILSQNQ